ncbi:isocitrate lyase/PEP mutase family protein [Sphingomonas bacterium]|uniref:isocitrate lyase/PEP mutase family protein n=1 Tax=Sphingomonas bacterium TaxID=1895847 RepID=UPI001576FA47|nr:isocitrate lyase/PEP mutase family protein [Sphingomonas bacterium]
MANPILRQKVENGTFFAAPGLQDMISATIAKDVGFDVVYGTGYWLTASAYGLPDAGIATYSQMVDRMATLVRTCGGAAVIADADTGYGGLLNVHHTVRGYEAAGVSAVQIEDQEFPKKCGHTPYKRCLPTQDMIRKIEVALAARTDPDLLIIARSDARAGEGFEAMLRRCEAYAAAGADLIFPEALLTQEEMRQACASIPKPCIANMADGGVTPILPAQTLQEIGYACAIYPAMCGLAAAAAVRHALTRFKTTGTSVMPDVPLHDFQHFCRLIGFEEVWAFEERWAS